MSEDQLRIALATWAGVGNMYLLLKRGFYWRPDAKGYTSNIQEAGRYSKEYVSRFEGDEAIEIRKAPLPALTLDWIHELEDRLTDEEWDAYTHQLCEILIGWIAKTASADWPNCYLSRDEGAKLIHATAPKKAEAMARALGLWVESEKEEPRG